MTAAAVTPAFLGDEDRALHTLGQRMLRMPDEQRRLWIGNLPPHDLLVAERAFALVAAQGWRSSPSAMAEHLTGGDYKRYAYIEYLSGKFVDAVEGRSVRQIWNLPARYGKSLLGSRWGPAWAIDRTGGRARMILVSYAHNLAVENAIGVRDILVQYADELRGQLRADRRKRDRFATDLGGGVLAAGIDGTIIGFGAGYGGGIVLDDPYKNWQQAHSEGRRQHVVNQYKGTLRHRLDQEEAWIIVIHHRVHEDDLTATLVAEAAADEGDEWEVIALPAIAVEDDVLGRAPGEPLCAERYSLEACLSRARGLGTYLASGLEQQNPTPEEGNELLRAWFVLVEPSEMPTKPERAITSWDLKLKNREAGDYVVGQCLWRVGQTVWVVDQIRGHYDHATTACAIALLGVRHPEVRRHVIESAGSADEVIPELKKAIDGYEVSDEMAARLGMTAEERVAVSDLRRAGMAQLTAEPAVGDKSVRARAYIAPTAEPGNVRFPADASWVPGLLDELAAFPDGAYDDQVDALSQGIKHVAKRNRMKGYSAADEQW